LLKLDGSTKGVYRAGKFDQRAVAVSLTKRLPYLASARRP